MKSLSRDDWGAMCDLNVAIDTFTGFGAQKSVLRSTQEMRFRLMKEQF